MLPMRAFATHSARYLQGRTRETTSSGFFSEYETRRMLRMRPRSLLFRWYRIMSPNIKISVNNVTYNEARQELYVDCTQEFRIRWSPLRVAPAR